MVLAEKLRRAARILPTLLVSSWLCAGSLDAQCAEGDSCSVKEAPRFATCADGGAAAADGSCEASGSSGFKVLASLEEPPFDPVKVVRTRPFRHDIDFLLTGPSCIGARYVDEEFSDQFVFKIFNILQASRFLVPKPHFALALGLGAGDVPNAWRSDGISTDVVELHPAVVRAASKFFRYVEDGPHGTTTVANARGTIFGSKPTKAYDLVLHDLFAGMNPAALLSRQLFAKIRDDWLAHDGVLLVNFLGYHAPPPEATSGRDAEDARAAYPFSAALARTLRSLFPAVRCFTDHEPDCPRPKKGRGAPGCSQGEPSNIVCWCSRAPWHITLPSDDPMYADPAENTAFWTIKHFQSWEVLLSDGLAEPVVDEADAAETWAAANDIIASHMSRIVRENLLPHDRLWQVLTR